MRLSTTHCDSITTNYHNLCPLSLSLIKLIIVWQTRTNTGSSSMLDICKHFTQLVPPSRLSIEADLQARTGQWELLLCTWS